MWIFQNIWLRNNDIRAVETRPNKQTHPTGWAFLSGSIVYRFEVILPL